MRPPVVSRRSVLLGLGAAGLSAVTGCDAPWSGDESPRWERTPVRVNALAGHTGNVSCTAFSPDSGLLATGGWDGTVLLWDAVTGKANGAPITLGGTVFAVEFSPDGATLAIARGEGYDVELWDVARRARTGELSAAWSRAVVSLAFSPDGGTLITGDEDTNARVWDPASGTDSGWALHHASPLIEVGFRPDGRTLATATPDGVLLWNTADPRRLAVPADPGFGPLATWKGSSDVAAMSLALDGETLAVATATDVVLLDPASNLREVRSIETGDDPASVALTPDGRTLATGFAKGRLRLWNTETGAPAGALLEPHTDTVRAVAFSPDGTRLATTSHDGTATLWRP
ncbi:WD domain G-beta repeat uncharacterized protein [Actinocorallia herbida]|uniref:WD domain G-beta repeat uncharacterized protein n=1 Tax=Actinocorallia herbida TaxID=58109 RepID=A0A3N1D5Z3_9ACTN|nr:WD40 repeat domain-containing protein [Actinocorallia herbida]ROO88508.1 WD domain G-beta repeat uncharacterized protein [Actinocorallia herbida]